MKHRHTLQILVVIIYGLMSFAIGGRIVELTEGASTISWLQQTKDLDRNIPDRIPQEMIQAYPNRLVIIGDYELAVFENSNSMLPTLDYGSTGIQIWVNENTDLNIGDIVSYIPPGGKNNFTVVHRIVEKGTDDQGEYFYTKGDFLIEKDPYKVRRSMIKRVMVGIIW